METEPTPSLLGRIVLLIAEVARITDLFSRMPLAPRWVATLMHGRVWRLGERFRRLAARIEAGKMAPAKDLAPGAGHPPPRPPGSSPGAGLPSRGEGEARRVRKPWPLPRTIGWIGRNVAGAWLCTRALEQLLAEAEMPSLVAAVPQSGRLLRPLCDLLWVKPPEYLRLPRRRRKDSAPGASRSSPRPSPRRGEGEARGEGEGTRVRSWVEEDAPAMRERVARWVRQYGTDPPSTLLPLGLTRSVEFPGTQASDSKKPG